jgi:hypothetical protein
VKKVITPAEKEVAEYYTDFNNEKFVFDPPVELQINFGYGSEYDGTGITLHLNDEEIKPILDIIKQRISDEYKNYHRDKIAKMKNKLVGSVEPSENWYISSSNLYDNVSYFNLMLYLLK